MRILAILSRNSVRGSRTRSPEDRVPYPAGFRGTLAHDPARCTGCRTCAYVCSPGAITFGEADPRCIEWAYFAGQCTFCGRCVEYCPTQAICLKGESPVVTGDQSRHRLVHQVFYKPCARCGQLILPVPEPVLARLYNEQLSAEMVTHHGLCEKCRRKLASQRLKDAAMGANR